MHNNQKKNYNFKEPNEEWGHKQNNLLWPFPLLPMSLLMIRNSARIYHLFIVSFAICDY